MEFYPDDTIQGRNQIAVTVRECVYLFDLIGDDGKEILDQDERVLRKNLFELLLDRVVKVIDDDGHSTSKEMALTEFLTECDPHPQYFNFELAKEGLQVNNISVIYVGYMSDIEFQQEKDRFENIQQARNTRPPSPPPVAVYIDENGNEIGSRTFGANCKRGDGGDGISPRHQPQTQSPMHSYQPSPSSIRPNRLQRLPIQQVYTAEEFGQNPRSPHYSGHLGQSGPAKRPLIKTVAYSEKGKIGVFKTPRGDYCIVRRKR